MATAETSKDEPAADRGELLLQFLDGRSVACPRCGYDLRDLTRPVCPECGEELVLTVGRKHPNYELLIATLAPGIFSGIAAGLLLVPITYFALAESRRAPLGIVALDLFGLASAFGALVLFRCRRRFMNQPRRHQIFWVIVIWAIHVATFAVLTVLMVLL